MLRPRNLPGISTLVPVELQPDTFKRLQALSASTGRTPHSFVAQAIELICADQRLRGQLTALIAAQSGLDPAEVA